MSYTAPVSTAASTASLLGSQRLTTHAALRMQQRGIGADGLQAALAYGRRIRAKGLTFCVLGRKEVQRQAERGVDLRDFEGLQVLLSHDGAVVTVYRNRDLHAIRATPRRRGHRGTVRH